MARILRPQGIRGEVIAELLTDFPERFAGQAVIALQPPAAGSPSRNAVVEGFRLHSGRIVLKLSCSHSRNDAEALRDHHIVVPWEQRTALGEDSIYVADLVGCRLIDTRSGQTVGEIRDVDRESTNLDLLVVAREAGGDVLVPFVKAYAPAWDLQQKTLQMELPAGLLDLETQAPDLSGRRSLREKGGSS